MTHRFVIGGHLPSLNDYIRAERGGWAAANSMKQTCQTEIIIAARQARIRHIKSPVYLCYVFYEKNKRRDLDNIAAVAHKFVQDALVESGILDGDGWDHVTGFSDEFYIDKKDPRIEVTIVEVNN